MVWVRSRLHLTILRQPDGSLEFDVFRKPTHTNQYIAWDSDQPLAHKGSTILSLTRRARLIRTGHTRQEAELKRVHQGHQTLQLLPPTSHTSTPTHQHHHPPHQVPPVPVATTAPPKTQSHRLPTLPSRNFRDHQPSRQHYLDQQELTPHSTRPPQRPHLPHPQVVNGVPHPMRR
jgi:hypothetical protein